MKIQVTKEDIKKGEQGSCEYCPVALAIQRVCGKDKIIIVDHSHADLFGIKAHGKNTINSRRLLETLFTPLIIIVKLYADDFWKYFKPFSFKIGKRIRIKE